VATDGIEDAKDQTLGDARAARYAVDLTGDDACHLCGDPAACDWDMAGHHEQGERLLHPKGESQYSSGTNLKPSCDRPVLAPGVCLTAVGVGGSANVPYCCLLNFESEWAAGRPKRIRSGRR
jgi:hypothetical protein